MKKRAYNLLRRYGAALFAVGLALGVSASLQPFVDHVLVSPFFAAVLLAAWYGGTGPGLAATFLSAFVIDFLLVPPILALEFRWSDSMRISVFMLVALVISSLTAARKRAEENLRQAHDRLQGLMAERVKALAALQESEERFRGAFEATPIGMALVGQDGGWLRVNRSLCQMLGHTEQELLTMTFHDLNPPRGLTMDLDHIWQLLAGGEPFHQLERQCVHKDGNLVWILLSISLVRNAEAKPLYFVFQLQDITLRKQAMEEVQKARDDVDLRIRERVAGLVKTNEELRRKLAQEKQP